MRPNCDTSLSQNEAAESSHCVRHYFAVKFPKHFLPQHKETEAGDATEEFLAFSSLSPQCAHSLCRRRRCRWQVEWPGKDSKETEISRGERTCERWALVQRLLLIPPSYSWWTTDKLYMLFTLHATFNRDKYNQLFPFL